MPGPTRIYHSSAISPDEIVLARCDARWAPADELWGRELSTAPLVLLADRTLADRATGIARLPQLVVVVATDAAMARALGDRADLSLADISDVRARSRLVEAACALADTRAALGELRTANVHADDEFQDMSRIGMALMTERDRNALLRLVVHAGKRLTGSDGCGLLFVESDGNKRHVLVPAIYDFHSIPTLRTPDIRFPIDDTNVVGHAAATKEPVVVEDVHALPERASFVGSAEFERRFDYHAQSMLAVPMLDHQRTVLGVLFFVNRKRDPMAIVRTEADCERYVLPYSDHEVRLGRSLASQTAVAIENERLYMRIELLLESIVKAAVSAIDERDPTTAGHSLRVASLASEMADAVSRTDSGPLRNVSFTPTELRELRFAAMLHDLGKVVVREAVLLKTNKLPPESWAEVAARFELIRFSIQCEHARRKAEVGCNGDASSDAVRGIDADLKEQLRELERARDVVRRANEPTVFDASPPAELPEVAKRTFVGPDGKQTRYLTEDELHYLTIRRGTLDDSERVEAESHVAHTARLLSEIPWTKDLKNLVAYAYGHHEKLDGSGYPQGLTAHEIPLQTRLITLADMYDALTEADRPYKPAVPPEEALAILRRQADKGVLDRDLVTILGDVVHARAVPLALPAGSARDD